MAGAHGNQLVSGPAEQPGAISAKPYEAMTPNGAQPLSGCLVGTGELRVPVDGSFTTARFEGPGGSGPPDPADPCQRNDDGMSLAIHLPFTFRLYGADYATCYINNNGFVSFAAPDSDYTATGFPTSRYAMVAPFWADADTRNAASGVVHYRIDSQRLIVAWDHVGYYRTHADKRNTFEVIISDGTDPMLGVGQNVAFSYGDMQWTTGDASRGADGFGGTAATVGVNRGDGVRFVQVGRFDHEGSDYDGSGGNADGVSYLDGQWLVFDVAGPPNTPPIAEGFPEGFAESVCVGERLVLFTAFFSEEPEQLIATEVDLQGLENARVTTELGNPSTQTLVFTPSPAQGGREYTVRYIATDDGEPPASTEVALRLYVCMSSYTVSASAGPGGTISPSGATTVPRHGEQTFTVTPETCYDIADVVVDGASLGPLAAYTFTNVDAHHTITASFALETRLITASAGPGGTIAPAGGAVVDCGGSATFSLVPDAHHHIADLLVDGNSVGPQSSFTFGNVIADHAIAAVFAIDTHPLSVVIHGSGTVTLSPELPRYDYGTTVQLAATPATGWVFRGWSGDASGTGTVTSVLVDGDKAVTATFAIVTAFEFKPHRLNLTSQGKWVTGYVRPPAPWLASQIDVTSIRLNGVVPVSPEYPAKIEDHGARLKVKFARAGVKPTLAPGDNVPITITGMIAGDWFKGTDYIKVNSPKIHTPAAGEALLAGAAADVTWSVDGGAATLPVTLLSSFDDGVTWGVETEGLPNTGSCRWMVPSVTTGQARLAVMLIYDSDETGVVPEAEFAESDGFSIVVSTAVGGSGVTLALRAPNPVVGPCVVSFSLSSGDPATLAVYDVGGRAVFSGEVGSLGGGVHTVHLGDLPAGMYVVRLSQAGRSLSSRMAVIR
jgi:uncharacterized repeat protein (TIGR02543 family)